MNARRWLVWYLRAYAVLLLLALPAVVMPFDWMVAIADWLEAGTLARSPLSGYLTRSLSLLYAGVGMVVLYASRDLDRYWHLVTFFGRLVVSFGALMVLIDLAVGMPPSWTWSDGPTTMLSGVLMLYLQGRCDPPAE